MTRGDLVTVAAGSGFGSKPRPALVLQSDDHPTSTVILALLTSTLTPEENFRPRLAPGARNGLRETSDVMVDLLISVRREKIGAVIGALSVDELARVERALLIILGMAA